MTHTDTQTSPALARARKYAAMLPKGTQYEIEEHDFCVQLTVRNSIEYLIVTISDSRDGRTRARAVWALFGSKKTHRVALLHLPTRLRDWFVS